MKIFFIFFLISCGFTANAAEKQTITKSAEVEKNDKKNGEHNVDKKDDKTSNTQRNDDEEERPSKNRNSGSFLEYRSSVGLDFQISDNELSPSGTYNNPDDEALIGGSGGFFMRHRFNNRFGITTGGELVVRKLEQDYDQWFFSIDPGSTRYDIFSLEIPIYAELYLGNGNHTLYIGPKLATPLYQHCSDSVNDTSAALPCKKNAARDLFIPLQLGYHLWLNDVFGLTFFIEGSLTPIVDKEDLDSKSTRTGVLAMFYF